LLFDQPRIDSLAEVHLDTDGLSSMPLNDLCHALSEEPVNADNNLISGLNEIGDGGFHTSHARAR